MTAIDYAALAAETAADIADAGGPGTLVVQSEGVYDPASSAVEAPKARRVEIVLFRDEYSLRDREGGLVLDRDCKLVIGTVNLIGGAVPEPKPGDSVEFAGQTYEVVRADSFSPAGIAVYYDVHARVP